MKAKSDPERESTQHSAEPAGDVQNTLSQCLTIAGKKQAGEHRKLFFFLTFIYLFIYLGCVGSSLLRAGFL